MKVITKAPAKVNWTLEVLGRRNDGYHEIRTLLQTIDLGDTLVFVPADDVIVEQVGGPTIPDDDNLVARAAKLLRKEAGYESGAHIQLQKMIPVSAGFGGGSSDAAATLRGLNKLWRLGLNESELAALGAELGSDVPFFVYGGTALAEGRGETVKPLPDVAKKWLVLVLPPFQVPSKTTAMYKQLHPEDYSDGNKTNQLANDLAKGLPPNEDLFTNAFERAAFEVFPKLETYWQKLSKESSRRVHLAGSGPTIFILADSEEEATALAKRLRVETDAEVYTAVTLDSKEPTAVTIIEE
jgi:4-diphosphocytidyl-2-C-methyl-D-erythritol kinase